MQITPNKLQYYIKPSQTYFEGDFSSFKKLLKTEVSFDYLQSIFLGDFPKIPVKMKSVFTKTHIMFWETKKIKT